VDRASPGGSAPARPERRERDLGRISSFSDGVLAIAITLLVLNIDVPQLSDPSRLPSALLDLWPDLVSYALSFAVVGRFWIVHHRILATLQALDGTMMMLNLVFLGAVALMPFVSELLALYGDEPVTAMAYAAVLTAASLTSWGMIRHARSRGLVAPDARRESRHYGTKAALLLPAVFVASLPVALLSPLAAELMWGASFFVSPLHRARAARGRAREANGAP
jgi:uncharacterized membrane protein